MFHLTINGTPFCDWTGCIAHQHDARAAQVTNCEYHDVKTAALAANRLKAIKPHAMVCIALGDCPTMAAAVA